jgi:hypothetical protein
MPNTNKPNNTMKINESKPPTPTNSHIAPASLAQLSEIALQLAAQGKPRQPPPQAELDSLLASLGKRLAHYPSFPDNSPNVKKTS